MNRHLFVALGCLALSGCGVNPSETQELRSQLAKLETEIALLKYSPDPAEERLQAIEGRLTAIESAKPQDYAVLAPGSSGYSIAATRLGPILVSLGDLEVRGKGTTIELSLGNTTAAHIEGAALTVVYAADGESGKAGKVYVAQHAHLGALRPGTWSVASVNLPELKPDELGEIRVLVGIDVVQMR